MSRDNRGLAEAALALLQRLIHFVKVCPERRNRIMRGYAGWFCKLRGFASGGKIPELHNQHGYHPLLQSGTDPLNGKLAGQSFQHLRRPTVRQRQMLYDLSCTPLAPAPDCKLMFGHRPNGRVHRVETSL